MAIFYYLIFYSAAVIFVSACLVRIRRYARAPLHLRWEVYPISHEEPARAKHGGSRFEEVDWWTKPARRNLAGELKFMIPEVLLLKGLRDFNRRLWYRSFPFHFGLYLLAGTITLLMAGAAAMILAPASGPHAFVRIIRILYEVTGSAGLALAIPGACGLLALRIRDESLRACTAPGDRFNLLLFIVTLSVLAAALMLKSASAPNMLEITRGMLTFDTGLRIPALLGAGLVLAALLAAYIPLTHMSHFIAKYFTYHSVRWDDAPNPRGGSMETRMAQYLAYRPTWAAAHVGADGRKTWAEIAAAGPAAGAKK